MILVPDNSANRGVEMKQGDQITTGRHFAHNFQQQGKNEPLLAETEYTVPYAYCDALNRVLKGEAA